MDFEVLGRPWEAQVQQMPVLLQEDAVGLGEEAGAARIRRVGLDAGGVNLRPRPHGAARTYRVAVDPDLNKLEGFSEAPWSSSSATG